MPCELLQKEAGCTVYFLPVLNTKADNKVITCEVIQVLLQAFTKFANYVHTWVCVDFTVFLVVSYRDEQTVQRKSPSVSSYPFLPFLISPASYQSHFCGTSIHCVIIYLWDWTAWLPIHLPARQNKYPAAQDICSFKSSLLPFPCRHGAEGTPPSRQVTKAHPK